MFRELEPNPTPPAEGEASNATGNLAPETRHRDDHLPHLDDLPPGAPLPQGGFTFGFRRPPTGTPPLHANPAAQADKRPMSFSENEQESKRQAIASDSVHVYHSCVKLADGRLALTCDIGARGNACGDEWATEAQKVASEAGARCEFTQRKSPLHIEGVGKTVERCDTDVEVLGAIPLKDGSRAMKSVYTAPVIPNSSVPALLGRESLTALRAVIDCATKQVHFLTEDNPTFTPPSDARTVQAELSPSGHMLIPFAEYHLLASPSTPATVLPVVETNASSSSSKPSTDSPPIR